MLSFAPAARAQTRPGADTTRARPAARQPVRNLNYDRNAPQSPPPPGEINRGQGSVPGVQRRPAATTPTDTAVPALTVALADTSRRVRDSLNVVLLKRRSQVETTVKYQAKDSIQFDIPTKTARLYNKASVDYGAAMNLKAGLITVNYGTSTVQAAGRRDTVKHKMADLPLLRDGSGTYSAGRIAYNFKSKKGKISDVVSQQGEGYVHAETVKKLADNTTYGRQGTYTTCNLAHPHFYIAAPKMKVIPGEKIITGPFHFVIGDVPLPIGLPFGYFPTPKGGRGSGFIIPTFGQGAQRGLNLTGGGYYWAPNDYIGVRLTGDVYAGTGARFGGYGLNGELTYRKRYKYQGSFRVSFSQQPATIASVATVGVDAPSTLNTLINAYWVSWTHSPTPLPGGGVFQASVQAGSSRYNALNTLIPRQALAASFNSTISYSKTSRRLPLNYTIQLAQTQNVQSGSESQTFTLPNFNLGLARQYPYQLFTRESRGAWYEQFAVSYNLVAQNQLSSQVPARSLAGDVPLLGGSNQAYNIPFSFANLGPLLRNAQSGLQHQFQITLPSVALLNRHIQVQPGVSYGETWYPQRLDFKFQPLARAIKIDTVRGFNRAYSYSANVAATTNFYGTVQVKGDHFVKAIRHKVTPSVAYSFSPDLSDSFNGIDKLNSDRLQQAYTGRLLDPRQFSRYQGFVYGASGSGRVSALSLSVQNSIEMKVRNKQDTTGTEPTRKVSLADGLDFNVSYNFAAQTNPRKALAANALSPLSLNYRVQIARKLNVQANSLFSFYQRDSTGRELIDQYLFQAGSRRLARLLNASLNLSYQFNPAARPRSKANIPRAVAPSNDPTLGAPLPQAIYADYIDFDIPWEASLSYTASYTTAGAPLRPLRPGQLPRPLLANNGLSVTGSVKLTPEFRLSTQLNYDFVTNRFAYPSINVYRDLHCWQISGFWVPVGPYRSYNVTIAAKSTLLQDLKLTRNRTLLNR